MAQQQLQLQYLYFTNSTEKIPDQILRPFVKFLVNEANQYNWNQMSVSEWNAVHTAHATRNQMWTAIEQDMEWLINKHHRQLVFLCRDFIGKMRTACARVDSLLDKINPDNFMQYKDQVAQAYQQLQGRLEQCSVNIAECVAIWELFSTAALLGYYQNQEHRHQVRRVCTELRQVIFVLQPLHCYIGGKMAALQSITREIEMQPSEQFAHWYADNP